MRKKGTLAAIAVAFYTFLPTDNHSFGCRFAKIGNTVLVRCHSQDVGWAVPTEIVGGHSPPYILLNKAPYRRVVKKGQMQGA